MYRVQRNRSPIVHLAIICVCSLDISNSRPKIPTRALNISHICRMCVEKRVSKNGIQDECVRGTDIQISKRGASLTHVFFRSVSKIFVWRPFWCWTMLRGERWARISHFNWSGAQRENKYTQQTKRSCLESVRKCSTRRSCSMQLTSSFIFYMQDSSFELCFV